MSAQHTPGPYWVEGSIYEGYAACVVGRVEAGGAAGHETRTLAQVRRLPDAMLFSAAPELLEALETVRSNMRNGVTGAEARKGWAKASAAIAKARGEA